MFKFPKFIKISPFYIRAFQQARIEAKRNQRKVNPEDLLISILSQTELEVVRALNLLGLEPDLIRGKMENKIIPVEPNNSKFSKSRSFFSKFKFVTQFFEPSPFDRGALSEIYKNSSARAHELKNYELRVHDLLWAYTVTEHSPLLPLLKALDLSIEDVQRVIIDNPK